MVPQSQVPLEETRPAPNSRLFGVSIRGWITLLLVITFCVIVLRDISYRDSFISLVSMAVGYYFRAEIKK